MTEIQKILFRILAIQDSNQIGNDSIRIIYNDGSFEDKLKSNLNNFEKEKVLYVNDQGGSYNEFGFIPSNKVVVYLDQSRKEIEPYKIIEIQKANESKDNSYFRRLLIINYDTVFVSNPNIDGSWLSGNFSKLNLKLSEMRSYVEKVYYNNAEMIEKSKVELENKIFQNLSSDQLSEYKAELNRLYSLRGDDNGFLNPILVNLQGLANNASSFVEKNADEIAIAGVVVFTGGVAAAGGFGATTAGYIETARNAYASVQAGGSIFPAIETIKIPSAVTAIIDQGKKIIDESNRRGQEPVSEAQVINEQYVAPTELNIDKKVLPIIGGLVLLGLMFI